MPRYRYGCEDCGTTFARKGDVPADCKPYTFHVELDPTPGQEGRYRWSDLGAAF